MYRIEKEGLKETTKTRNLYKMAWHCSKSVVSAAETMILVAVSKGCRFSSNFTCNQITKVTLVTKYD